MANDTVTDETADLDTTSEPHDEENSERRNIKDRLVLPFLVPLVGTVVVALLGFSFSRIFLAGSSKEAEGAAEAAEHASKSGAPVMWATIITLFVIGAAALVSMMKSMRTTTFTLLVAGGIVLTIMAGSVLAGSGDVQEVATDIGRPTAAELEAADPANIVSIEALGTNLFQSSEFTANAGVIDIIYIGKGGSHRLKFANDARFNWFDLPANPGSVENQPIKLDTGEYTVFCPIAGHEKMIATLVVK